LTPVSKGPKRKIPTPLKRVRKEIPPPGQRFEDKKKYNRRRAKEELKKGLEEGS